jgi:O-antigen chain-terminating methyltransferase
MGLDVRTQDALEFLSTTNERFDGIYCSHFVEHLPIELVQQLLAGLARVLDDHGLAVLAFPDPESIRAQLMGFWRDPEHVRFYHPDLVASLAQAAGLECEWSSYQDQPHEVDFFPLEPAPLRSLPEYSLQKPGGLTRLWRWLGIATREELDQQQNLIRAQQEVIQQLAERSEQLWAVNRTWGWRDTVVLKLKRRPR